MRLENRVALKDLVAEVPDTTAEYSAVSARGEVAAGLGTVVDLAGLAVRPQSASEGVALTNEGFPPPMPAGGRGSRRS